jgi:dTDP-4-amino-4,6-dideoxygalactose transaminase
MNGARKVLNTVRSMAGSSQPIPPAKPYFPKSDIEEMKTHVEKILNSGMLTLGEYTRQFEQMFAASTKVKNAIAVNSGTSALEIALRTQKVRQGDEVIVPTNTFGATAAAVIFAGARPVITDINAKTLTVDASLVKSAITKRTKGVIAVHIGGLVCPEISEIQEICDDHGLFLIEDAAHAHGSKIGGRSAGSFGTAGAFSFYPTKVVTSGEGGIITTNSADVASIAAVLRDQGKENFSGNKIVMVGYNWRLPEISAALGILQLKRLQEFIANRNSIAKRYDGALDEIGIERIVTPPDVVNNYYKYTFFLPRGIDRDKFKAICRQRGVGYSGEVYWPPLHLQPAYQEFVSDKARFDAIEEWGRRMVNPPMFSQMTTEQVETVLQVTRGTLSELKGS